jgi:hypothetical protein
LLKFRKNGEEFLDFVFEDGDVVLMAADYGFVVVIGVEQRVGFRSGSVVAGEVGQPGAAAAWGRESE